MNDPSLERIITIALIPAIATLFGLLIAVGKAIITHLLNENKELKAERQGVMTTMIETAKNQQESINSIGAYVRELAKEQDVARELARRLALEKGGAQ